MSQQPFLAEGDIIEIKTGMRVYAKIPERFIYDNRRDAPMSSLASTLVEVGETRELAARGKQPAQAFDSSSMAGRFLVVGARMAGGSHGSINSNNDYPDGHQVTAQRLDAAGQPEPAAEISFYQSGAFSATIPPDEIAPIGRMVKSVSWSPAPAPLLPPVDIQAKREAKAAPAPAPALRIRPPNH